MNCNTGSSKCTDPEAFAYVLREAAERPLITGALIVLVALIVLAKKRMSRKEDSR